MVKATRSESGVRLTPFIPNPDGDGQVAKTTRHRMFLISGATITISALFVIVLSLISQSKSSSFDVVYGKRSVFIMNHCATTPHTEWDTSVPIGDPMYASNYSTIPFPSPNEFGSPMGDCTPHGHELLAQQAALMKKVLPAPIQFFLSAGGTKQYQTAAVIADTLGLENATDYDPIHRRADDCYTTTVADEIFHPMLNGVCARPTPTEFQELIGQWMLDVPAESSSLRQLAADVLLGGNESQNASVPDLMTMDTTVDDLGDLHGADKIFGKVALYFLSEIAAGLTPAWGLLTNDQVYSMFPLQRWWDRVVNGPPSLNARRRSALLRGLWDGLISQKSGTQVYIASSVDLIGIADLLDLKWEAGPYPLLAAPFGSGLLFHLPETTAEGLHDAEVTVEFYAPLLGAAVGPQQKETDKADKSARTAAKIHTTSQNQKGTKQIVDSDGELVEESGDVVGHKQQQPASQGLRADKVKTTDDVQPGEEGQGTDEGQESDGTRRLEVFELYSTPVMFSSVPAVTPSPSPFDPPSLLRRLSSHQSDDDHTHETQFNKTQAKQDASLTNPPRKREENEEYLSAIAPTFCSVFHPTWEDDDSPTPNSCGKILVSQLKELLDGKVVGACAETDINVHP